ncbi:hypothetical protein HPB48_022428 [Haemaphysalis longicornis]|uniref:Uncharacterized protein n=1 Tax=Haemaphysalis longicornis TaxID=44386 RepID=A0A9J6FRL2_HAELO|nr:hypothetical protein HPB48_022428 [Haemaphysalis longicornis]
MASSVPASAATTLRRAFTRTSNTPGCAGVPVVAGGSLASRNVPRPRAHCHHRAGLLRRCSREEGPNGRRYCGILPRSVEHGAAGRLAVSPTASLLLDVDGVQFAHDDGGKRDGPLAALALCCPTPVQIPQVLELPAKHFQRRPHCGVGLLPLSVHRRALQSVEVLGEFPISREENSETAGSVVGLRLTSVSSGKPSMSASVGTAPARCRSSPGSTLAGVPGPPSPLSVMTTRSGELERESPRAIAFDTAAPWWARSTI